MNYCRACFEEDGIKTEIKYKMFDIDGTNLEELPTCPLIKEHNIKHSVINNKDLSKFNIYYLDEEDIINIDEE